VNGARGECPGVPAAAFAAALAAAPAASGVRVTLCGNLVHYLALPWPAELDDAEEAAAGWTFRFDAEEGGVRVACATERGLLEALQDAARAGKRRLESVRPFLAAAFNGWRGEFGAGGALFVTLEPGRWTAALVAGGQWRSLRSGRLEEDVAGALVSLVARETALAADERLPVRVYAPAFPRLGAQLEGLGERVRLLQRPAEPLYAPAAH
jgi:hypothetical protein